MKNNFFKLSLLLAIGFTTAIFTSCNQSEPEVKNDFVIEARNVIDVPDEIATVGTMLWHMSNFFVQVPFQNRGFTMTLPKTVADEHLEQITLLFWQHSGITSSDGNAKGLVISTFAAFDKENVMLGLLALDNSVANYRHRVMWIYVDRNTVLEYLYRSEQSEISINLNLKMGWNVAYQSIGLGGVHTLTITTQKPSDVDFEWYFWVPLHHPGLSIDNWHRKLKNIV